MNPFRRSQEWRIGYLRGTLASLLKDQGPVVWLDPSDPHRRFWADPFAFLVDGEAYVLCEEFDYWRHRGRIVCIRLPAPDGEVVPEVAIERPYHLSYPFVFEADGSHFCIPESAAARRVDLYRMGDAPWEWSMERTLIDGISLLDPTLVEWNNSWWLFGTAAGKDKGADLHIWSAKHFTGPWHPHQHNPVKSDARSSRPAGRFLILGDRLIRPAQDCSKSYGARVVLNEIVSLSHDRFEERVTSVVEPHPDEPYSEGLHTLTSAGDYLLIDGLRIGIKWLDFASRLRRGVRKLLDVTVRIDVRNF